MQRKTVNRNEPERATTSANLFPRASAKTLLCTLPYAIQLWKHRVRMSHTCCAGSHVCDVWRQGRNLRAAMREMPRNRRNERREVDATRKLQRVHARITRWPTAQSRGEGRWHRWLGASESAVLRMPPHYDGAVRDLGDPVGAVQPAQWLAGAALRRVLAGRWLEVFRGARLEASAAQTETVTNRGDERGSGTHVQY